ncbi:hypothetical protein ABZS76_33385 [Streptomyces sp. NPDC005562]|uniref:hypothetical protein n=1 Tax=Streptomyces sp. NPDC005562 TaxID=3154890 RepID=UPI0033AC3DE9
MGGLQLVGRPDHAILSTSTDLLPLRGAWISHDVNGYYRALGVTSDVSRRELMRAYRARGGENDVRLTYVLSQLLNSRTRARYDAAPPGKPFVDRYVIAQWRRQAEQIAARRNALNDTHETAEDILKSLGLAFEEPSDEFLDSAPADSFDDDGTRDRQPSPHSPTTWPYSYLLLASTCDDVSRLAQWQGGLGHALADRGIRQFAVGFHGTSDLSFLVSKDLGTPVIFLHENVQVTGELIAAAATAAVG